MGGGGETGRDWSGGGVSGVRTLTWSGSLPISRPFCVAVCPCRSLSFSVSPRGLDSRVSPSAFVWVTVSLSLSRAFRIFVFPPSSPHSAPFLASGRPVLESVPPLSPSARRGSSCTCPHLPRGRRNSPCPHWRRGRPATFRRRGRLRLAPGPGAAARAGIGPSGAAAPGGVGPAWN